MHSFSDAQNMHLKHPSDFWAPSLEELDEIKKSDFVKICNNNERFWIEVTEVNGNIIKGRIDNDLVREQPFKCDDIIECEKRHIYQIEKMSKSILKDVVKKSLEQIQNKYSGEAESMTKH
jgi:hypothetical protein